MHTRNTNKRTRERGQVMLIIMLFMLAGSLVIVSSIVTLVGSQLKVMKEHSFSTTAYAVAEGALEEVVYRHKKGMNVSSSEALTESGVTVTTDTGTVPGGIDVVARGSYAGRVRTLRAVLLEGDGASFSFGVQTNNGGIIMENSSSIDGNVYSNGPVDGFNLSRVKGTVISAGPSGLIVDVHATGSAYAHTINDSYVEKDAYYQSMNIGTVVDGTSYPGSPDIATSSMPITDTLLDSWEAYAAAAQIMTAQCTAAGGTITYDSNVTLGPAKIPCNVAFEKFPTVTISGVLWITGNVTMKQGPKFVIDPAIGNKSIPIIVNDPANQLTSSKVTMNNSGTWSGNGNRSYLMVVSRNKSAELGGAEKAILIAQSSGGALLVYAGHGEINLQNNTNLTMITAWRVRLQNSTEVKYDRGLASAIFTTGPGGSYSIDEWKEIE